MKKPLPYAFAYSGTWEVYKRFKTFRRMVRFVNRIPHYELNYSGCFKFVKGLMYRGAYHIQENGKITVKF